MFSGCKTGLWTIHAFLGLMEMWGMINWRNISTPHLPSMAAPSFFSTSALPTLCSQFVAEPNLSPITLCSLQTTCNRSPQITSTRVNCPSSHNRRPAMPHRLLGSIPATFYLLSIALTYWKTTGRSLSPSLNFFERRCTWVAAIRFELHGTKLQLWWL